MFCHRVRYSVQQDITGPKGLEGYKGVKEKTMKRVIASLTLLMVTLVATQATADMVYTFQNAPAGYTGTEDTLIIATSPDVNSGTLGTIVLSTTANRRTMIQFDLSSFTAPVGETLSSATIRLNCSYAGSSDSDVSVYEVYRSWTEGIAGDTTGPTWNEYEKNGDYLWGTAGCDNTTSDRSGTAESITTTLAGVTGWHEFSLTTDLVNGWIGNTIDNNGVILVGGNPVNPEQRTYYSSESGTLSLRPELVLTYTPEPATMVLLGLGGVGLLVRRRRRA